MTLVFSDGLAEVYHSAIALENELKKTENQITDPTLTGEWETLMKDISDDKSGLPIKKGFSSKSDIFSFSIVLWEMVAR